MTRTDIKLFGKKLTKYAYYRTIFFGIASLTLIISFNLLPKLEGVNISSMSDTEFTAFIGDDFILYIGLLVLILFLAISGVTVFVLYILYVIQLKNVSNSESSRYLRNILMCELLRPVVWAVQLTFLDGMHQSGFQLLNCVSGGISIFVIIQFKKWVESFQDNRIRSSGVTPLHSFLTIWLICIFSFSLVSLFQGIGIFIQIIGEFNGIFLVIIECALLLVISLILWMFGKKLVSLF